MARQRCKATTLDPFFDHLLYQQKVPEGHFLRKLDEVIPVHVSPPMKLDSLFSLTAI